MLAAAYAQKAREIGRRPVLRQGRRRCCEQALQRDPADPAALTERAALSLSRHDFRAGLRDARAARRAGPELNRPFGVLVDALVELGRYREAGRALQAMVDRKPDVAAYCARVLLARAARRPRRRPPGHGAGRRAPAADTADSAAWVGAQLSHLDLLRGRLRLAGARGARGALPRSRASGVLGGAGARRGRARRTARGDRAPAPARRAAAAARVRDRARRVRAGGRPPRRGAARPRAGARRAAPALGRGREHGRRGGRLRGRSRLAARARSRSARRAWAAAPSVRSADALGWALTRAGRPRGRPALGASRAGARLPRPGVPRPRRGRRPRGGPGRPRPRRCSPPRGARRGCRRVLAREVGR